MELKFGPALQNTAGSGASLKDLDILARGCHGTWLPRVTDPKQRFNPVGIADVRVRCLREVADCVGPGAWIGRRGSGDVVRATW